MTENSWSKSERKAIDEVYELFGSLFKDVSQKNMTAGDFVALISKVYIVEMDIEHGRPFEIVAISILSRIVRVAPELIWGILIKSSLHYARSRFSVDIQGITSALKLYLSTGDDDKTLPSPTLAEEWKTVIYGAQLPSSGREYILVDSVFPEFDLILVELYRFDDLCNKKL